MAGPTNLENNIFLLTLRNGGKHLELYLSPNTSVHGNIFRVPFQSKSTYIHIQTLFLVQFTIVIYMYLYFCYNLDTLADGDWHHCVATVDSTTVEMFLDGVSILNSVAPPKQLPPYDIAGI